MSSYETVMKGIRILPGSWRPHFPWEHIAWISPPWASHDYVWYDFPEAIFTDTGLIYLSHVNPAFPVSFPNPPKMPWEEEEDGISYERELPNGIRFGGSLRKGGENKVETELHISNQSDAPLGNITLQTCIFLRASKEFSDYTAKNKYVHAPGEGWIPFPNATSLQVASGQFRLGWRSGPKIADLPVMATASNEGRRFIAVTWFGDTYSLVSNPGHPCMHADPHFADLEAGEEASIRGRVVFHEGELGELRDLLIPGS
jgi:hypothetical protein